MSTILNTAVKAIDTWNEVRNNHTSAIKYFNSGCSFIISREDYESWKLLWENLDEPSDYSIHGYLGLSMGDMAADFSLYLFNVDSHTDSLNPEEYSEEYMKYLKQSSYVSSLIGEIDISKGLEGFEMQNAEALQKTTSWNLYKNEWIFSQTNLVQLFNIPFSDLHTLFQNPSAENLVLIPALNSANNDDLHIDLIMWAHRVSEGILWQYSPKDFLRPCPPYCEDLAQYQLLAYALQPLMN